MSNDSLKVTLVVPVYNKQEFIRRGINSIIHQTYQNIEVILVDDGSTDNSGMICNEFANKYNNILVIHQKNQGLGMARNAGINIASGDYIGFMDPDDYIDPNMVAHLINDIKTGDYDASRCLFIHVDQDNNKYFQKSSRRIFKGKEVNNFLAGIVGSLPSSKNDFDFDMSVCTGLFRKSIIDENNIKFKSEREYICEDLIFDIDFFQKCESVSILNENLYYYTFNSGSLSHHYIKNRLSKEKFLYNAESERLPLDNEMALRLDKFFLGRIRNTIYQCVHYSDNTKREQLDEIKMIVSDPLVIKVISAYPWEKCPLKQRIFNFALKQKNYRLCYFFAAIR